MKSSKTLIAILITVLLIAVLILPSVFHKHTLSIALEIEEPKNAIISLLIPLLKTSSAEQIMIEVKDSEYAHIDSLKNGSVDILSLIHI